MIDGSKELVVRLVLLRHGKVASHKGDTELTEFGWAQSLAAGRWFAQQGWSFAEIGQSPTRRTRETATGFVQAYAGEAEGSQGSVIRQDRCALRNPDLYLGGHRVNMVSSPEAFAEQAPGLTADDVSAVTWFREWMASEDRIGAWVADDEPPGDTVQDVASRMDAYLLSLRDVPAYRGGTVLGITHSPILRALMAVHLGGDPGEPENLHGLTMTLSDTGAVEVEFIAPDLKLDAAGV